MGVQRRVHGLPVVWVFPPDFPERLKRFQEESGQSTRGLARLLGVSPDRIRKWKKGDASPDHTHLFALVTIAGAIGLREVLLKRPELDLAEGIDLEVLRSVRRKHIGYLQAKEEGQ